MEFPPTPNQNKKNAFMGMLPENAWSVTKIRLSMTKMLPNNAFYVRFST
jgi:hypothetical protein